MDIPPEKLLEFYEFSEKIPLAKRYMNINFEKLLYNDIRDKILGVMKEGIMETHPTTGESVKRLVLSTNEIRELLKKKHKLSIDKSLFYHVNMLKKAEIVEVVDSVIIGKRETAFYARTGLTIIIGSDRNPALDILKDKNIVKLIESINLDLKPTQVKDEMQRINSQIDAHMASLPGNAESILDWLEENRSTFMQFENANVLVMKILQFADAIDAAYSLKTGVWDEYMKFWKLLKLPEL